MAKKIIFSPLAPAPIGPYSQAVMIQDTLYVSGQIAVEQVSSPDIAVEANQVLTYIGYILSEAGLDFSDVVKASIFLKNMDDFSVVNEVYGRYFSENPPARETVQVSKLPKDVRVEISVIAVKS